MLQIIAPPVGGRHSQRPPDRTENAISHCNIAVLTSCFEVFSIKQKDTMSETANTFGALCFFLVLTILDVWLYADCPILLKALTLNEYSVFSLSCSTLYSVLVVLPT